MSSLRRNIELKVRYADLDSGRQIVAGMGAKFSARQMQRDTYFCCQKGRLKLREIDAEREGTLIWYDRKDEREFRDSAYYLVAAPDAGALKAALSAGCGVRGVVEKRREIHLYHNVRIHLDEVVGLGTFLEFEAVLETAEDRANSRVRLETLYEALGIKEGDHCAGSYADLMGISVCGGSH